jgi:hypothetical protein
MAKSTQQECFVIMPISDQDGYEKGHFRRVYEDIIIPACEKSEYKAVRADEVEQTDIIHLSILKKLIEAPMAICDLSTRNPNVLFELGLRQAFDKPVVLIQEKGTERIFDVSILRAYDYCKELRYNEVLKDQDSIAKMLKGTEKAFVTGEGFNSVIKLLSLAKGAQVQAIDDPNEQLKMIVYQLTSQMQDISDELGKLRKNETIVLNSRTNDNSNNFIYKKIRRMEMWYDRFLDAANNKDYDQMIYIYNKIKDIPINSELDKAIFQDIESSCLNLNKTKKK